MHRVYGGHGACTGQAQDFHTTCTGHTQGISRKYSGTRVGGGLHCPTPLSPSRRCGEGLVGRSANGDLAIHDGSRRCVSLAVCLFFFSVHSQTAMCGRGGCKVRSIILCFRLSPQLMQGAVFFSCLWLSQGLAAGAVYAPQPPIRGWVGGCVGVPNVCPVSVVRLVFVRNHFSNPEGSTSTLTQPLWQPHTHRPRNQTYRPTNLLHLMVRRPPFWYRPGFESKGARNNNVLLKCP